MGAVAKALKDKLFSYTLYDVIDNKRIKRRRRQLQEIAFHKQIRKCLWIQTKSTLRNFVIAEAIYFFVSKLFSTTNYNLYYFGLSNRKYFHIIFTYPIIEELAFRGVLQNYIWVIQEVAAFRFHISKKSGRIAQWLISPGCRILVTQIVFASVHLGNRGKYVSTAGAVTQFVCIILSPTYSFLYESTDNFFVSISSHMVNNLIVLAALRAMESQA